MLRLEKKLTLKVVDYEPVSFTEADAVKVLSFDYSDRVDLAGCDRAEVFFWNSFTGPTPIVTSLDLEI